MYGSCVVSLVDELVVAIGREALDMCKFGKTAIATSARQHRDHVDGFGDQGARDGDNGFLNQLLQPTQGTDGRSRMQGADTAGMAGAPGLQQVEGLGAAHFADRNTVRAEPE